MRSNTLTWAIIVVIAAVGGYLINEITGESRQPAPISEQATTPTGTQPAQTGAPGDGRPTLAVVRERDALNCGVNTGLAGFGITDSQGRWTGFDVDVCRAVAAATLGDAGKVNYTPLSAQQRFTALQSKEVDLLSRNTTWTLGRDTSLGLDFAAVTFYDGQGFMVPKSANITGAKQLANASICVQPGTTTELNLADYFRANDMNFRPVVIESLQEVISAFFAGRCDVLTTDVSGLVSLRVNNAANPDDYVVLPEVISKEPLGPAVRHGDDQWFDIVKWTVFAMMEAEEKGITSANVDERRDSSEDPAVRRLLGVTPGNGKALGLSEDWAYNVIKQVGNYGESYERNITKQLGLERGLNALWTDGGLIYAMPVR